jgi:hypothetical protein
VRLCCAGLWRGYCLQVCWQTDEIITVSSPSLHISIISLVLAFINNWIAMFAEYLQTVFLGKTYTYFVVKNCQIAQPFVSILMGLYLLFAKIFWLLQCDSALSFLFVND